MDRRCVSPFFEETAFRRSREQPKPFHLADEEERAGDDNGGGAALKTGTRTRGTCPLLALGQGQLDCPARIRLEDNSALERRSGRQQLFGGGGALVGDAGQDDRLG